MTHWHSVFFLPRKIYHLQLKHPWAGRVYHFWFMWLARKWTRFKVANLQFHFVFCWACLIKSELANQALYCGLRLRRERVGFVGMIKLGKNAEVSTPLCKTHCWHYLALLPEGQASAHVSNLGSFGGSLAGWWKNLYIPPRWILPSSPCPLETSSSIQ